MSESIGDWNTRNWSGGEWNEIPETGVHGHDAESIESAPPYPETCPHGIPVKNYCDRCASGD